MQKLFKVIEKRFLPKKAEENQDKTKSDKNRELVVSTTILPNFKVVVVVVVVVVVFLSSFVNTQS
jgi:hypothetical protein